MLVIVGGCTDPDGNTVSMRITGVTQAEALNGLGDGDTSPDAQAAANPWQVWLRAERSGTGDGRVYRIAFTATDGHGGTTSGVVTVGVPHDNNGAAVDTTSVSVDSFG